MSLRKCAPVVHVHYFPLSPSSRRVPSVSGSHAAALPAYRAPNCAKSTETSCGPIGAHPPGRACDRCPGPEMAERATTQRADSFRWKESKAGRRRVYCATRAADLRREEALLPVLLQLLQLLVALPCRESSELQLLPLSIRLGRVPGCSTEGSAVFLEAVTFLFERHPKKLPRRKGSLLASRLRSCEHFGGPRWESSCLPSRRTRHAGRPGQLWA